MVLNKTPVTELCFDLFQGLNPGAAIAEMKKLMLGQESKGIPYAGTEGH